MRDLKNMFNESILSDEGGEDLYQFADRLALVKEFSGKYKSTKTSRAAIDGMGNRLEVGDLVLFIKPKGYVNTIKLGVIVDIRGAFVAVCGDGDINNLPKDGSGKIRTDIHCSNILKVNEDIAKQIIKL